MADLAREFIDRELAAPAGSNVPGQPGYACVASADEPAERGTLLPETVQILRSDRGEVFFLYYTGSTRRTRLAETKATS